MPTGCIPSCNDEVPQHVREATQLALFSEANDWVRHEHVAVIEGSKISKYNERGTAKLTRCVISRKCVSSGNGGLLVL
jgi:hypothetical protein